MLFMQWITKMPMRLSGIPGPFICMVSSFVEFVIFTFMFLAIFITCMSIFELCDLDLILFSFIRDACEYKCELSV